MYQSVLYSLHFRSFYITAAQNLFSFPSLSIILSDICSKQYIKLGKLFRMPYYAVARGHSTGVYSSWDQCKSNTNNYPNARFKKFNTKQEAEQFIRDNSDERGFASSRRVITPNRYSNPSSFHYVVANGDRPGIYNSWNECQEAFGSFAKPVFRKFEDRGEAEAFLNVKGSANLSARKRSFPSSNERSPKRLIVPSSEDIPVVYTDGACSYNGTDRAAAGYGIYWGDGHADNVSAPVSGAPTNNRAEYEAIAVALKQAKKNGFKQLKVCTDSMLLINSMTKWLPSWKRNNWKKSDGKAVLNRDLLEKIDGLKANLDVHFEHVKGHAGIHGNEMADRLAVEGARKYLTAKRRV